MRCTLGRSPSSGPRLRSCPCARYRSSGRSWSASSSRSRTNSLWALDAFHVVGGGLWTGIDLFFGLVLGPILGRMSIQARVELTARLMPKMVLIMPTLVTMTLAAGFQLARHNGMLDAGYPHHALGGRVDDRRRA